MATDNDSTVEFTPRIVLFDARERPLRRQIGFQPPAMNTQTRGTNPSLYTNTRKPAKPKKGK